MTSRREKIKQVYFPKFGDRKIKEFMERFNEKKSDLEPIKNRRGMNGYMLKKQKQKAKIMPKKKLN